AGVIQLVSNELIGWIVAEGILIFDDRLLVIFALEQLFGLLKMEFGGSQPGSLKMSPIRRIVRLLIQGDHEISGSAIVIAALGFLDTSVVRLLRSAPGKMKYGCNDQEQEELMTILQ